LASPNHVNLIVVENEVLFFNERNETYYPTLRLLHKCIYLSIYLAIVFYPFRSS